MSKLESNAVFVLIKSLTKAEKRYFGVHYKSVGGKIPLFYKLFEVLKDMEAYREKKILKHPEFKKSQLSNLKRELYYHLLEALRQLSVNKDLRIEIRQDIDFAQVLYSKGLYKQSLKLLNRAKRKAIKIHDIELKVQVLEFEKIIEARHITRSIENRAKQLRSESIRSMTQLQRLSLLSDLALAMYEEYITKGHVRSEEEARELRLYFSERAGAYNLIDSSRADAALFQPEQLSFYERVNLYQAHSWYAYILQDFLLYYRYVQKWVDLFEKFPKQKAFDVPLYLKALNNLLTAHFYTMNSKGFDKALSQLSMFWEDRGGRTTKNMQSLAFVYLYTARFNQHFMKGTFAEGVYLVEECEQGLAQYREQIDEYRQLVFYYKIASLYFGSGNNAAAVRYLNKIVNLKIGSLKSDIQCFARILLLIVHYEMKHYDVLEYLFPSVIHFLEKHREISAIFVEIIRFLKRFDQFGFRGLTTAFIDLKNNLNEIAKDPYERRFLLYLDVISWLESKIERQSVQAIIRKKFEYGLPRI